MSSPPSETLTGPASPGRSVCAPESVAPYGNADRVRQALRTSRRGVARQPRYAVEIGIIAGQFGQAVGVHEGNREGIVRKQTDLPAHGCSSNHRSSVNRNDMDPRPNDACDGRLTVRERLHDVGLCLSR